MCVVVCMQACCGLHGNEKEINKTFGHFVLHVCAVCCGKINVTASAQTNLILKVFLVFNLHLKTDSRQTKQKKQRTKIISQKHSREKQKLGLICLRKEIVLSFFLNDLFFSF